MPCGDVRIRREGSGTATGREEGRVVTDGGQELPWPQPGTRGPASNRDAKTGGHRFSLSTFGRNQPTRTGLQASGLQNHGRINLGCF